MFLRRIDYGAIVTPLVDPREQMPWIPRAEIRGAVASSIDPSELAVHAERGVRHFNVEDRAPWLAALGVLSPPSA